MGRHAINLMGQKFGRLTVIGRTAVVERTSIYEKDPLPPNFGSAMWICQCECGNTHLARGTNLRQGHTKRCRHCVEENLSVEAADETVVRVWCHAFGEYGGFAEAVSAQGQHLAHTHWSVEPLRFTPIGNCRLVRRIMILLEETGRIRTRKAREPVAHWAKATGCAIELKRMTAQDQLANKWFELAGLVTPGGNSPEPEQHPQAAPTRTRARLPSRYTPEGIAALIKMGKYRKPKTYGPAGT